MLAEMRRMLVLKSNMIFLLVQHKPNWNHSRPIIHWYCVNMKSTVITILFIISTLSIFEKSISYGPMTFKRMFLIWTNVLANWVWNLTTMYQLWGNSTDFFLIHFWVGSTLSDWVVHCSLAAGELKVLCKI